VVEKKAHISEEEKLLIQRAKSGDKEAYQELISFHTQHLYRYIYRMVGNHEDAEDLLQETLAAGYAELHQFRGKSQLSTWLYRIAINLSCKAFKKRQLASANTEVKIRDEHSLQTDGTISKEIADSHPNALAQAIEQETNQKIRLSISSLPSGLAEILTLRELEGYNYHEISQRLHIPIGTVMSRLNRARLRLAHNLKKYGLGGE
jgi:RNA polymerase sigma-70 factor (ECF subfamily)